MAWFSPNDDIQALYCVTSLEMNHHFDVQVMTQSKYIPPTLHMCTPTLCTRPSSVPRTVPAVLLRARRLRLVNLGIYLGVLGGNILLITLEDQ